MTTWAIEFLDSDEPDSNNWIKVALEMCRVSRHCGCLDKSEMDVCDYTFDTTDDYSVAKAKFERLKSEGDRVRLVQIQERGALVGPIK